MQIGWRQKYATSRNLFTKTMASYSQKPSLKAYLEILLSLFTISILGIFAIRPTTITIGKLYNEIKAKEETIKRMDQKIQNLKKLRTRMKLRKKQRMNRKIYRFEI